MRPTELGKVQFKGRSEVQSIQGMVSSWRVRWGGLALSGSWGGGGVGGSVDRK